MHLQDAFRFCNRIGVRLRNDVTAQATAEVTAAMDPEGRTPFRRSRCPVWCIYISTSTNYMPKYLDSFQIDIQAVEKYGLLIKHKKTMLHSSALKGNDALRCSYTLLTLSHWWQAPTLQTRTKVSPSRRPDGPYGYTCIAYTTSSLPEGLHDL